MSESKHTPGPWAVHGRFSIVIVPLEHKYRLLGAAENEEIDKERYALPIAQTCYDSISGFAHERAKEEAQANARLIAAAPDLLEACEEAIGEIELRETSTSGKVLEILRAARDKAKPKAEGETQ